MNPDCLLRHPTQEEIDKVFPPEKKATIFAKDRVQVYIYPHYVGGPVQRDMCWMGGVVLQIFGDQATIEIDKTGGRCVQMNRWNEDLRPEPSAPK